MRWIAFAALVAASGCATTFNGSAKVERGVEGCRATCAGWGMELAGMIKAGEYSDGCICQVKDWDRAQPGASRRTGPPTSAVVPGASGPFMAAATGVYLQTQASQRNATAAGAYGGPQWSPAPHYR